MDCYRVRIPDFDLDQRWTYDHEWYWAVEGSRIYFVGKSNFEPGAENPRLMTWDDSDWDEDRTGWPIEMKLTSKVSWDSDLEGTGPRFPRTPVVGGVWNVQVGDCTYECLRALTLSFRGRREGRTPAQLAAKYRTLVEYYINMGGRSVLFRRYNGPAWYPDSQSSLEALYSKGCPALLYNGVEFCLWYDCVPLHALSPGNTEAK